MKTKFLESFIKSAIAKNDPSAFESIGLTFGYICKHSSSLARRTSEDVFMVLWGNTLMFYKNENLVECETPGDRECMYLLETSVVKHLSFGDEDNSFLLFYPFSPIKLTAQSRSHTIKWLVSFSKIIAKLGRSPLLKGELFKLLKSNPENKKRFIVFHDTSVAVYRQEGDLALPAYSAQPLLPGESDVQFLDAEEEIIITEIRPSHDDKRRQLRLGFKIGREISTESYSKWKNEIIQRRELLRKRLFAFFNDSVFSSGSNQPEGPLDRGSLSAFEYSEADLVEARGDGVIYSGNVRMRPKTGGDISTWTQCQLRLMLPSIEIRSMDGKLIVKDKLTPSSSAYETALGDYTFQLVSTRLISQISVSNASERTIWLALLREAIRESISDSSDSLFQQAVLRVDFDEIYHLDVPSVRPLGLVFERVGEWAVVQSSKLEDSTSVSEGSILCAVDNQPVLFEAYRDSVSLLRKARPPMRLSFRRSPRKEGELFKLSHQKDSKGKSSYSWKKRIFALDRGKLGYRRSGTPSSGTNAPVELSLVGARVALFLDEDENFDIPGVDPSDPDLHAFVVSSGLATVLVRCKSHKEMMEWAGAAFHAIALANGGGYISEYEGDRIQAFGGAPVSPKMPVVSMRINPPVVELDENLAQRLSEVHMADARGAFQATDEALEDFAEEIFVPDARLRRKAPTLRQNNTYVFDRALEADEEDIRRVFRECTARKRKNSIAYARCVGGDAYLNPIQFSLLWRRISTEKGNLYKEMQLFKYFDVQGYGMLTEDEFVDGWRGLAEKPLDVLGVYVDGHAILKKIKMYVQ